MDFGKIETSCIHFGESTPPSKGSISDIVMATTFSLDEEVSFSSENLTAKTPFTYSRWKNPTVEILEKKMANLEGGEAAVAFSSGIGACTNTILSFLGKNDRIVVSDICYPGVREFCNSTLTELGIEVEIVNMSILDDVKKALTKPAKLIFIETPCNPILRLSDIKALSEMAHENNTLVIVDSTFATPMATRPLLLGADIVVHSMTKYLGGHGDMIGGIAIGRHELVQKLRSDAIIHLGNVMSPFSSWLINRGLATLPLRMQKHSENAQYIAKCLEGHPSVLRVNYPGLPAHPQYELAKNQMDILPGVLSFQAKDSEKLTRRMRSKLGMIHYAVSLGHHKSLIFYIPTKEIQLSSYRLPKKNLEAYTEFAGKGVFRLSVGLENKFDILDDLLRAL